ncbi:MAG: hypothetical protein ACK55I_42220, partial [bacterium]
MDLGKRGHHQDGHAHQVDLLQDRVLRAASAGRERHQEGLDLQRHQPLRDSIRSEDRDAADRSTRPAHAVIEEGDHLRGRILCHGNHEPRARIASTVERHPPRAD